MKQGFKTKILLRKKRVFKNKRNIFYKTNFMFREKGSIPFVFLLDEIGYIHYN